MDKNTLKIVGKPVAIIFDWDNTLIDSWPTILDALNTTFRAFKMTTWTMDEAKVRVAKSMRNSFPLLFGDEWQEAGEIFYKRYAAIHLRKLHPLPGAENLLRILTKKNIYLSVVSNKNGDYLRNEANQLGWEQYFSTLIGAMDAERDKPDPKPVDMALKSSSINKGPNVWFVGDSSIDLECAYNAGLTGILIRNKPPSLKEFKEHPPAQHFHDCDELCKFVINL